MGFSSNGVGGRRGQAFRVKASKMRQVRQAKKMKKTHIAKALKSRVKNHFKADKVEVTESNYVNLSKAERLQQIKDLAASVKAQADDVETHLYAVENELNGAKVVAANDKLNDWENEAEKIRTKADDMLDGDRKAWNRNKLDAKHGELLYMQTKMAELNTDLTALDDGSTQAEVDAAHDTIDSTDTDAPSNYRKYYRNTKLSEALASYSAPDVFDTSALSRSAAVKATLKRGSVAAPQVGRHSSSTGQQQFTDMLTNANGGRGLAVGKGGAGKIGKFGGKGNRLGIGAKGPRQIGQFGKTAKPQRIVPAEGSTEAKVAKESEKLVEKQEAETKETRKAEDKKAKNDLKHNRMRRKGKRIKAKANEEMGNLEKVVNTVHNIRMEEAVKRTNTIAAREAAQDGASATEAANPMVMQYQNQMQKDKQEDAIVKQLMGKHSINFLSL